MKLFTDYHDIINKCGQIFGIRAFCFSSRGPINQLKPWLYFARWLLNLIAIEEPYQI